MSGTSSFSGSSAGTSAATYSYSGTPGNSDLDKLRFLVSDVGLQGTAGGTVWMFSDTEIEFFVSEESDWDGRVAFTCETLARQWSRIPSITIDGARIDQQQVAKAYADRAKELRASSYRIQSTSVNVTRKDGYSDDYNSYEDDNSTANSQDLDQIEYFRGFPLQWKTS